MNFRKKLMTVLTKLGLADKAKTNALTNDDWQRIAISYRLDYRSSLRDDMNADGDEANDDANAANAANANAANAAGTPGDPALSQEELNSVQAILTQALNPAAGEPAVPADPAARATAQSLTALARNVSELVNRLSSAAAPDLPVHTAIAGLLTPGGPGTTATHLFGIEHPMFSMSKRWNRITATPGYALTAAVAENDSRDFFAGVCSYSASLQARFAYLHANSMLDAQKLAAGDFSTNYQGVDDAKVGDRYIIRRQDALIARVLKKRDLTQYFPVRYGIQDHDLVFNAFFDTVSQGYQPGRIFKGGMKIENETGHVDDAMIKLRFGPMKELERKYTGYLNKEGSDPVKWSMIEFAVLHSLETAQVEQNKRRVRGIYVKPEAGVPGHCLNASTGLLYTLIRYAKENKFLLHDASYRSYDKATMLSAVREYHSDVIASCTEDMDIDSHVLYLNAMHRSRWIECVRAEYGKETDFAGPGSYANTVPDTGTRIVRLPYLGQLPLMLTDIPGNLQFLEFIPGEMLALKVKEDMEEVIAWSTWKEGTAAAFVGRRFSTRQAPVDNSYEFQQIFMNKFCVSLAAGATTVDARKGFRHETVANAAATAITDVAGAKEGVAYIIECGDTTNASTVAKAGNFSEITAAWTPAAVGDYLMLIKLSTGKFAELERCVAGSRTVNATLQPNLPGVR